VHPQVAIHLAQWLSPKFAVLVSKWVYDWISSGASPAASRLPFHVRRYVANQQNVPVGHFSVLTEMTLGLIGPMEADGYTLPERMWPDISEGLISRGGYAKKRDSIPTLCRPILTTSRMGGNRARLKHTQINCSPIFENTLPKIGSLTMALAILPNAIPRPLVT
jgi:hypothetical protein